MAGGSALLISPSALIPSKAKAEILKEAAPDLLEEGLRPLTCSPCSSGRAGISEIWVIKSDRVILEMASFGIASDKPEIAVSITGDPEAFFSVELDRIAKPSHRDPDLAPWIQTVSIRLPGDDENRREIFESLKNRNDDFFVVGKDKDGDPVLLSFDASSKEGRETFEEVFGLPWPYPTA